MPQAKEAEKAITNPAGAAKKADAKVKEAVPQAKEAEKVATGKSSSPSFDLGSIFGSSTKETAEKVDAKVPIGSAAFPMSCCPSTRPGYGIGDTTSD